MREKAGEFSLQPFFQGQPPRGAKGAKSIAGKLSGSANLFLRLLCIFVAIQCWRRL
jgi:hypothetical protein